MTQALARTPQPDRDEERRTLVSYKVTSDPWPDIARWAQKYGFHPREPQTGNVKLFQKGSAFWTAAMRAQFSYDGVGTMKLHAWIPISVFVRIATLFLLPAEMHIRSGGFKAVLPRRIARSAVNELLAQVGGPQIP